MRPFRGTHDYLPNEEEMCQQFIEAARWRAGLHGYRSVSTPIFEYADVFSRSLGDASDIVTKEMFTFKDRHDDTLVLRPEGTAGIMRAVLSNKLTGELPLRYFYAGAMFRYERPQKGRQRQFHQIGIEHIGESAPGADIEVIDAARDFFYSCGLLEKVSLHINSLGDQESRTAYRKALVEYFSDLKDELSAESQIRLEKNPLRILDSKDATDQKLVAAAPTLGSFLNGESQDFFGKVLEGLDDLKINYTLNPHLVRGLDYYCHTAFEFVSGDLGAQSAVLAGGRYDQLSKFLGHREAIPSIGWAAGVERLVLLSGEEEPLDIRPVSVIPIGPAAEKYAPFLAQEMRLMKTKTVLSHKGSLKSRMKYANKINARCAVIFGDDEMEKKTVIVKDLDTGHQEEMDRDRVPDYFKFGEK